MKTYKVKFKANLAEKEILAENFRYYEGMLEFYKGGAAKFEVIASFPKDNILSIEVK